MRQLLGQLLLVSQHRPYAVQERVQRAAQLGEFGRTRSAAEAFVGVGGTPSGGLVRHGVHRAQCPPHCQSGEGVGAGQHGDVQCDGREEHGVGGAEVGREVQCGDHDCARCGAVGRRDGHGTQPDRSAGVQGGAALPAVSGEGVCGAGEGLHIGAVRRMFEQEPARVDPHVVVQQCVVRRFQHSYGAANRVDRRGDSGGPGAQMVVGLVLEALLDDRIEDDSEDRHQQQGGGHRDQGEPAAQGAWPPAGRTGCHERR